MSRGVAGIEDLGVGEAADIGAVPASTAVSPGELRSALTYPPEWGSIEWVSAVDRYWLTAVKVLGCGFRATLTVVLTHKKGGSKNTLPMSSPSAIASACRARFRTFQILIYW